MRILIISEVPTHPSTAGNRSYLRSICDTLNDQGHEVEFLHVVTYTRHPQHRWLLQRPGSNAEMAAAWGSALHVYRATIRDLGANWVAEPRRRPRLRSDQAPEGLAHTVASLVRAGRFDAVVVNYWNLMSSVKQLSGVLRILVANESFANETIKTGSGWKATDRMTEEWAFDTADVVLAIQDNEAEDFRSRTKTPVLTTYHYSTINPLPMGDPANLLFLGSSNPQNVEGMQDFLTRIYPAIRSEFSDLRLLIAGPICDSLSDLTLPDGVILQGVVENAADFYARGNLCISPNLRGGGLKTKILEALAHGRTVLASDYSLRDVPWVETAPLIACKEPRQYVDAVRARLTDNQLLAHEKERAIDYARSANAYFQQAIACALAVARPTKSAGVN